MNLNISKDLILYSCSAIIRKALLRKKSSQAARPAKTQSSKNFDGTIKLPLSVILFSDSFIYNTEEATTIMMINKFIKTNNLVIQNNRIYSRMIQTYSKLVLNP